MSSNERKWVLVTGGTGALGRHILRGFLSERWGVVFTSHSQESIQAVLQENGNSPFLLPVHCNLTEVGYTKLIAEKLDDREVEPVALVNGARNLHALRYDRDGMMPRANWQENFTLEVIVPYELTMFLAMRPSTALKSVVNLASIYGVVAPSLDIYESPLDSAVNYGPAKAALIHLTKELSIRLVERGIRVNAVSFGGMRGRSSEDFQQRYARHCPMRRMLEPDDVFKPIFFLATEDSKGVTGHNLLVDGGWTVW